MLKKGVNVLFKITHYITILVYYVCTLLPIKSDQFCFQTVYSYIKPQLINFDQVH